jgi:hypothetical protein
MESEEIGRYGLRVCSTKKQRVKGKTAGTCHGGDTRRRGGRPPPGGTPSRSNAGGEADAVAVRLLVRALCFFVFWEGVRCVGSAGVHGDCPIPARPNIASLARPNACLELRSKPYSTNGQPWRASGQTIVLSSPLGLLRLRWNEHAHETTRGCLGEPGNSYTPIRSTRTARRTPDTGVGRPSSADLPTPFFFAFVFIFSFSLFCLFCSV